MPFTLHILRARFASLFAFSSIYRLIPSKPSIASPRKPLGISAWDNLRSLPGFHFIGLPAGILNESFGCIPARHALIPEWKRSITRLALPNAVRTIWQHIRKVKSHFFNDGITNFHFFRRQFAADSHYVLLIKSCHDSFIT